jgi:hypothetical protein
MTFTTRNEIEYLSSIGPCSLPDPKLIQEMSRRLDALRRYDQHFCDSDWTPEPMSIRNRRQSAQPG